jgi:hypothetical protein
MNFDPAGRLLKIMRVLKYPFVTTVLTWVAKLVARPLYTAALQVRIQTSLKHHKCAQVGLYCMLSTMTHFFSFLYSNSFTSTRYLGSLFVFVQYV